MANSKGNIHYDGEYISSLAKMLTGAKGTLDEALGSLKGANRHEGWNCSERTRINEELGEISKKLERVKTGLGDGAVAMNKGAEMFASLENQASANENAVSEQVKKNWFFEAVKWVKGAVGSAISGIGGMITGIGGTKQSPITPVYSLPNLPMVTTQPAKSTVTSGSINLGDLKPDLPWVPEIPGWLLNLVPSLTDKK
ncbi:MAG: hypothetical protein LBS53_06055 [Synergistaceae bacterium]|jgi:hypothetical protein|nr:hypothetical protein [Synergistaceae bacterium]